MKPAEALPFPERRDTQRDERTPSQLEQLEEAVREDARRDADRYLEESEVPAGGE